MSISIVTECQANTINQTHSEQGESELGPKFWGEGSEKTF